MKFKAAILTELNSPLIVDEIESTELKFGQVFVKILKSGLCGAQLQEINGSKGNGKFLPHLMGHEGCGIVDSIGQGVTKVKIGDKVVLHWRKTSGIESDFPNYIWNGRKISSGKVTTFSEYSIVSENRITKIPDYVSDDFGALLGCGLSTGLSVVNNESNIKFGESVLILGCGGIGLNCIFASKLSHADPIIGVDISKYKQSLVEKNGGTFYHIDDLVSLFNKYKNFDCIIDTTGHFDLVSKCIPHLSEQGRCIFVAQPKENSTLTINNPIKFFSTNGLTFKSTQAGKFDPEIDIPKYIKLYLKNIIDTNSIITDSYNLDEINDAILKLKSGMSGRIMINI
jgi:S-(hydroxymethyl)glutathione dehydrogenase/alcohol dehydrogenase